MHIPCFGTLALLLKAKSSGLVNNLKPLLDELLEHRRYYSKDLIQIVLKHAGEL
jgi:predicted nucleic acid-binding protein